jgi:hypothetical protein
MKSPFFLFIFSFCSELCYFYAVFHLDVSADSQLMNVLFDTRVEVIVLRDKVLEGHGAFGVVILFSSFSFWRDMSARIFDDGSMTSGFMDVYH